MSILEEIETTLQSRGREQYGGEPVSQLAHALQCASLAEQQGECADLIAAALLHDIGHLIDSRFEEGQVNEIDRQHERIGAGYLSNHFPDSVTAPIRLHVDAKRYLCHVDSAYFDGLSEASIRSLRLQGGPFSENEAAAFIGQPYADDAVKLRLWDDEGKVADMETPPLSHFWAYVRDASSGG